ncbi:hypothetical protein BH20VER2_BH20VER2_14950 [soil metagenome]
MRDLEMRWQRLADQLALWTRHLTDRALYLDREIGELPALRGTWRATLDLARNSSAPPEVMQRIAAGAEDD